MRKAALKTSEASTEEPTAPDIVEHGPAALLMQCLRTTRQHLALAIGAMRDAAALSDDEDLSQRGAQLERILSAVEDRCTQLELGQRTFLLPEQFQQLAKLVKQRRESLYLTQLELSKRAGVCERTIKNIERREVSPVSYTHLTLPTSDLV